MDAKWAKPIDWSLPWDLNQMLHSELDFSNRDDFATLMDVNDLDRIDLIYEISFIDEEGKQVNLFTVGGIENGKPITKGRTVGGDCIAWYGSSLEEAFAEGYDGLITTIALECDRLNELSHRKSLGVSIEALIRESRG